MKAFLAISLFAPFALCQSAQVSCSDYGEAIYCSNGLSAVRAGSAVYFSDGTTAQTFGNITMIQGRAVQISPTASTDYAAGQMIGSIVGGVIANVRQRGKFERMCDVDPYARGWLNGMAAFCSRTAISDACANVPQFDFSGFKYAGDTPHHLSWSTVAETISYLPNWPSSGNEVECIPDVARHAVHEAQLWLFHKQEVELWSVNSHPRLTESDSARMVNHIYAHPESYDARKAARKAAAQMFEKIYIAVKAAS